MSNRPFAFNIYIMITWNMEATCLFFFSYVEHSNDINCVVQERARSEWYFRHQKESLRKQDVMEKNTPRPRGFAIASFRLYNLPFRSELFQVPCLRSVARVLTLELK